MTFPECQTMFNKAKIHILVKHGLRLTTSCDEGSKIGRQIKICLINNLRIMKKLVLLWSNPL